MSAGTRGRSREPRKRSEDSSLGILTAVGEEPFLLPSRLDKSWLFALEAGRAGEVRLQKNERWVAWTWVKFLPGLQ